MSGGELPQHLKLPEYKLRQIRQLMEEHKRLLETLTESTGYRLEENPNPEPHRFGWKTYPDKKLILYNPATLAGLIDEPEGEDAVLGILDHEVGHNTEYLKKVQDRMAGDLGRPPMLPQYYDDNGFLELCQGGVADVVDDAYVGRYPYVRLRQQIKAIQDVVKLDVERVVDGTKKALDAPETRPEVLVNLTYGALPTIVEESGVDLDTAVGEFRSFVEKVAEDPGRAEEAMTPFIKQVAEAAEKTVRNWGGTPGTETEGRLRAVFKDAVVGHLKRFPKPEQYIQLLLGEARNPSGYPLEQMVEPDVLEAYRRTMDSSVSIIAGEKGAVNVNPVEGLEDVSFSESTLFRGPYEDVSVDDKYGIYQQIRDEYSRLVEAEVKQRGRQKQEGKKGFGRGGRELSDSTPMTKQEREELIDRLKKSLRRVLEGEVGEVEPAPITLSKKDMQEIAKELGDELKKLSKKRKSLAEQDRDKDLEEKKGKPETPSERKPEPWEDIERLIRMLERDAKAGRARGLSEKYGVNARVAEEYNEIRERRRNVIDDLADELTEVFRQNRQAILNYQKRVGEVTPGLEAEYIAEVKSGEQEPPTMMNWDINPEFARTEIMFWVDVSGSMADAIRRCRETFVVVQEAFEITRDRLSNERLLRPDEELPLKVGVAMFDVRTHPVKDLRDPIDEESKIMTIRRLHEVGGGTDDFATVKPGYDEFTKEAEYRNVIKIGVLLSDAYGDTEKMPSLARQIREDNKILFLVLGFGSDAETVNKVWGDAMGGVERGNIFARPFPRESTEEATREVAGFLKREIPPRVEEQTRRFRGY